ncbi:hypothetical protein EAH80_26655 [Mycobacterium hodleri]|uniref:Uncharacterized protein n=1 Tax=Mycolicibacterium hodleri TaxID=49897 RepID=A0A502DZ93_9MYCO|nr:hypothetical protein EAH80_26655 [Mycolicibacterium hodleri]
MPSTAGRKLRVPEMSPGSLRSCPPDTSPGSLRSCPPDTSPGSAARSLTPTSVPDDLGLSTGLCVDC